MAETLLADLIEALKNDEDPKKLTQEQIKRLVKRTEQVTDEHILRIEKAGKEKTKNFPGATKDYSWRGSDRIEYMKYDNSHAAHQMFNEKLKNKAFQDRVIKSIASHLQKLDKENRYLPAFNVNFEEFLPKNELKARRKAENAKFDAIRKKQQAAVKAVKKDRDTIIDAAVFYKSEHIIDVLSEFEKKEYKV